MLDGPNQAQCFKLGTWNAIHMDRRTTQMKPKTDLVMIVPPIPLKDLRYVFTPGMDKPQMLHKSKVGSSIPKPPKKVK